MSDNTPAAAGAASPLPFSPPRRVVVVGAGVAGLAAAIRLKERGAEDVTILEQAERPGGLAISLRFEGVSHDLGPHRLHTEIPEVDRFYNDVAGESIIHVKRQSRMYIDGRFLAYPMTMGDLLRGPGPVKLAEFGLSWMWARCLDMAGRIDAGNYAGYMRRNFGSAVYNYLLGPYSHKVWKTDPALLDADAARVRVSAGSLARMIRNLFLGNRETRNPTALREFRYVRGGAETLVGHLRARAEALGAKLTLNCRARGFDLDANGVRAVRAHGPQGDITLPADAVISTIPLPPLVEALNAAAALDQETLAAARELRYLDMIFVSVIVARERISPDSWIYFPDPSVDFNRAYEAKAFDSSMGRDDRSVLCVEITCRPGQDLWPESDSAIAERVVAQLGKTGLIWPDEVIGRHVHRLRNAYPLYDRGYAARVDRILAGLAGIGNVVTAGRQGLFSFNNMDHSIYMGLKAAERVMTAARPAREWAAECEEFRGFRIVD